MTVIDICMVVDNDVRNDGRVRREAASLAAQGWLVLVIGIAVTGDAPAETNDSGFTIRLVRSRFLDKTMPGKYGKAIRMFIGYALVAREMRRARARIYHANDFTGLLMLALARLWNQVFVYDSHELYFDRSVRGGTTPTKRFFNLLRPLEKALARRGAATLTVGDGLADTLARTLGIPRPVVLRNAVDFRTLGQPEQRYPAGKRLIAHTGGITYGRHLPQLVETLLSLPQDTAVLLMGWGPLESTLKMQAQRQGVAERLVIVPPVSVNSVAPTLAQADLAAVLITSEAASYHLALPNKFFEAVAAGLPIVSSPIPEVKTLIERYDIGVICDPTDPHDIARAVQTILEPDNYQRFRANVFKAREELNWETEEKKLVAVYRRLLDDTPAAFKCFVP